jgi:hypothetical protein
MTKAVFVTSIGAVLFGAVLFGCWVAVHFGWALDDTGRLKLGDLSSWLQFVVTFIAVLAAVLTACLLYLQTRAQLETIASQTEANKQLLMGVMLDNLGRFESHLNYYGSGGLFRPTT